MRHAIFTNIGKARAENEDSYLLQTKPLTIIAVADGMGGHRAGEVASKMAVDIIAAYQFDLQEELLNQIVQAIEHANCQLIKSGLDHERYRGMGTTLAMGIIYNQDLYLGHIGDSRIYLFRTNQLKQLTTDHSLVNELLNQQQITLQEAFNHPQRHVITQALGAQVELDVETIKIPLLKNDLLLFCTDGLSDMIRFKEIESLFQTVGDIEQLTNLLGEKALENGGKDNITLIIYQIN